MENLKSHFPDIQLRAPGKLMISGEYAILENFTATVAAVSMYAICDIYLGLEPNLSALSPEAKQSFLAAEQRLRKTRAKLSINTQSLRSEGKKIGLGSSAASAALAAGAVYSVNGKDFEHPKARKKLFLDAFEGHKKISPQGSGADVAASVFGGIQKVQINDGSLECSPTSLPTKILTAVIWTKHEARTHVFLQKISDFKKQNPIKYMQAMERIHLASESMISSFEKNDPQLLIESTLDHFDATKRLGNLTDLPIVETHLFRIKELAKQFHGAAKPSGAGGGDVAIAFFSKSENLNQFSKSCENHGYKILPLKLGAQGIDKVKNLQNAIT